MGFTAAGHQGRVSGDAAHSYDPHISGNNGIHVLLMTPLQRFAPGVIPGPGCGSCGIHDILRYLTEGTASADCAMQNVNPTSQFLR